MKPHNLMILGVTIGVPIAIISSMANVEFPSPAVLMFAVGALFGKGYGVWERRQALKGGGE